jgi:tetratricopeptide (TPR) repeat protein
MLDWLPALGARKQALRALSALRRGDALEAEAACRAYFARRLSSKTGDLKGADAQMASVAALCAALRGDDVEVKAIAEMVGDSNHKSAVTERKAVQWLRAALDGDVSAVLSLMPPPESALGPHVSGIVLLALERSSGVEREHEEALQRYLTQAGAAAELQARIASALAVASLRSGDREGATRHLAEIPESAPPFHKALAAMARDDAEAAGQIIGTLPAEERAPAITVAAALALGTSSEVASRALEALGPHASSGARAALAASVAVALAREGKVKEARGVIQTETRGSPSPPLAMATAFVALVNGDAAEAQSALRSAPSADPTVTALRLLARAAGDNVDNLLSEVSAKPDLLPEHSQEVANAVLFALARAGRAPSEDDSPPWLLERPTDPEALYAWALLRLRQEAVKEAVDALAEAIAARPELADLGDASDAAALHLATQRVRAGKPDKVKALTSGVSSARLKSTATRLAALAYVQSEARSQGVTLSAETLPSFVEKLSKRLSPSSPEADLLAVLRGEVALARVRQLLRSGEAKEAVKHLDELRSVGSGDAAFLSVAVMLSQGDISLERAEETLKEALAKEPAHEGLHVLLAEVQTSLRGADAGLATLQAAGGAGGAQRGKLLGQALASAYRGARRGLEAKRYGFAELRRGTTATDALVAELREVLRFEVPARTADTGRERVTRAAVGSLLPEANLSARAHLLLSRAGAAAQRDPSLRGAVDAATQSLKRALLSDDTAGARAAEMELVELIGKVAA